jgi:RNase P/RNase MRP subunit POP5
MTGSLILLRRLVEMRQFEALQEAVLACRRSSAEQVLLALAQAHLGQPEAARQTLGC